MTYSHIAVETDGPLASLIFNRPQVLNAHRRRAQCIDANVAFHFKQWGGVQK